jgi:3',5'-cyclic AMP phosphodiesterase CpdA
VFRLAHVTDPHFRGFRGIGPGDLAGKRAVGLLNLAINRVRKHKMQLLEALREDLRAQAPDHLALTGDLSNVALEGEWRAALAWIDMSGVAPERVTVIPGNHDAYVGSVTESRSFERLFAPYMTNDLPNDRGQRPESGAAFDYPFVQFRDELALIGVSSAVPTGDLGAWGLIGDAQLARLEALLAAPELAGKTRVVLVHHPPVMHKDGEHRNLRDRAALVALLSRVGAELVLHGHDHQDERTTLAGPSGRPIPVVGAGSASYGGGPEKRARYNVYEIERGVITLVCRAHDEAKGAFQEVRRTRIA